MKRHKCPFCWAGYMVPIRQEGGWVCQDDGCRWSTPYGWSKADVAELFEVLSDARFGAIKRRP